MNIINKLKVEGAWKYMLLLSV